MQKAAKFHTHQCPFTHCHTLLLLLTSVCSFKFFFNHPKCTWGRSGHRPSWAYQRNTRPGPFLPSCVHKVQPGHTTLLALVYLRNTSLLPLLNYPWQFLILSLVPPLSLSPVSSLSTLHYCDSLYNHSTLKSKILTIGKEHVIFLTPSLLYLITVVTL